VKRFNIDICLLLFLSAVALSACAKRSSGEQAGEEEGEGEGESISDRVEVGKSALDNLELQYAKAEERELSPSLELPAEIVPIADRYATVGPRVSGRVVEVKVNVGDMVKRGDPLVVLESEAVGRARADLIAANARADVARRTAERQRRLLDDKVTSKRAVEEAEGALSVADADVQAAKTRLRTFGLPTSVSTKGNPARVVLTSPLSGTVVARSVHVGIWVEPSDTLVEVVDLSELWVLASVYENEMRNVEEGQPVHVEVRAYPGEVFKGAIDRVDPRLDEKNRSAQVRVVLPNPEHRLRPGMFATARIQGVHGHAPRRLLVVPWASVQQVDGHPAVFVKVEDGVFELRRIHTGERAGELVEILNGLAAGDEVVAEGSFLLKGQLLRSTLGEDE